MASLVLSCSAVGVLPKRLHFTFSDAAEGEAYCRRLETLLDRCIAPDEFRQRAGGLVILAEATSRSGGA